MSKKKNINFKSKNKIFISILKTFAFAFILLSSPVFKLNAYAHSHSAACYGGVEHICDGNEQTGGACFTQQSNGSYVKTCGKTSGKYYNSNGQYLSPQCNKIGVSATAVEPTQFKSTPLLKMNITFLDGHTETVNATRTDWSTVKDYSNGETITLYWNGLVNDAKTPGELSAKVEFTSPIVHTTTPTLTPAPTQSVEETPTPTLPIEEENNGDISNVVENGSENNNDELQEGTSLGVIEEEIEETPIPTPTSTPIPTIIDTPIPTKIVEESNINKPIYYEDEKETEEDVLTIEELQKQQEAERLKKEKEEREQFLKIVVPIALVGIVTVISLIVLFSYNVKKKKEEYETKHVNLHDFYDFK